VKFLIIGDIHYTRTAPARRKETYGEEILGKLAFLSEVAYDLGVQATIFTGDLFHRKRPTLREVHDLHRALYKFENAYAIVGNHDVVGHSSDDLTGTGIGLLFEAPVIESISRERGGLKEGFYITGADYCANYEGSDPYLVDTDGETPHIHVTHGMLVEDPLPFEGISQTHVEAVAVTTPSNVLLVNGHIHKPYDYPPIYNVGSLCRASIEDQKTNHEPRALVAAWQGGAWKVIDLPVPVEDDVWTEEDERPEAMKSDAIAEFVESLNSAEDFELESQDLLGNLCKQMDATPATVARVEELLEGEKE
jgi:DNA repair exonuclease SbcCD nuclease subunit